MKKVSKLISLATIASTSLAPILVTTGCSGGTTEVHILDVNDFHGAAPGFGDPDFDVNIENAGALRLAQETQEIINKYPGSIFISDGDMNAGDSFSVSTEAETFYPVCKAMDIRYSVVGNHA